MASEYIDCVAVIRAALLTYDLFAGRINDWGVQDTRNCPKLCLLCLLGA
jgi:hypothetical protein